MDWNGLKCAAGCYIIDVDRIIIIDDDKLIDIPEAPPVTMNVFPSIFMMVVGLLLSGGEVLRLLLLLRVVVPPSSLLPSLPTYSFISPPYAKAILDSTCN